MELIKALSSVSEYRPLEGYSAELLELATNGISRPDAMSRWQELGRSETSFYKAYKQLKDDLLRLAFVNRKSSDIEGRRLEVWEKYCKVKQLLITQKKEAAVCLGVELVRKARKAGFTEIVVGLASLLENHFGVIVYDARNYRKYGLLRKVYSKMYEDEIALRALQTKLVVTVNRNGEWSELTDEIRRIETKRHGSFTYMRFRFSVLSIWYDLIDDTEALFTAFRETVAFYKDCEVEVPVGILSNLHFRLTPKLIFLNQFAEAEAHISRALNYVAEGTQSWHLFTLQKACLGLISGKIGLTNGCLKKAFEVEDSHGNPDIFSRWNVVEELMKSNGAMSFDEVWKAVFG